MPDFILRPAFESDSSAIRNLIHQVGINPTSLDWRRFVVAESTDSQFMGCAQIKHHRDGSFELASLAVQQEYRGQGVARAIIAHFLAHSPLPLYLMCRSSLVSFYNKFGFREIGMEALPPYFRRILRLVRVLGFLTKHPSPSIMRLD